MEEKNNDKKLADDQQALHVGGVERCHFVLSFKNLTYSLKKNRTQGRTKLLLNSITGEARGGEILAVLGASGSGKSTFIDALANRMARGSLEGSITLNGEIFEGKVLKSISAYVMQDDLLFPMLTVEETLMFAAEFRMPRALPAAKKKARVQALIGRLGLTSAAKTIIGDEGRRGVSGGERRRVSIGTNIIHDPIVLFLDEPTSGLDSTSAFAVVRALRRIARSGSILIISVHQPSSRILGLLDSLILISQGQTVYFGSPGALPMYFSAFGHPIPDNANPAEYALDVVRELESSTTGPKPLVEFSNSWQSKRASQSPRGKYVNTSCSSLRDAISISISHGKLVSSTTGFANSFWIEILFLSKRSFMNSYRVPELYTVRLVGVLVTGFILATIFWKLDDSPKGVKERVSLFAFVMSTVFYTCVDALPAFLQERHIFARETAYNAYRRSSYVLANVAVSLPPLLVLSAAFAATTFFPVGLAGGTSGFCFFFLTIFVSFWAGSSFVTFLSAVISHVMVGYTVAVGILAYFLLFSGFFMNRIRIPGYWIWFHYLSLVKYPYQAVLRNEFDDESKCFARGVQIFDGTMMGSLPEATKAKALVAVSGVLGVTITENSCLTTGVDVLKEEGVMDLSKWNCLWITVAWGLFFRVLFYLALLLGSKNKRR